MVEVVLCVVEETYCFFAALTECAADCIDTECGECVG